MIKQLKLLALVLICTWLVSCSKNMLTIQPVNLLTQDAIFSSSATVDAYFASLYADIPMEDYSFCNGSFGQFPGNGNAYLANFTDEAGDSQNSGLGDVYSQIYKAIRNTNNLIARLPSQPAFSALQKAQWLGEAKFIRAYCYFGLVKYYGGVPILLTVQDVPVSVARSKEADVWDQVKKDLDSAAATLPVAYTYGRANKYAALALEARAMLHAGTLGTFDNTGNLSESAGINGVDAAHTLTYLQSAYDASNAIVQSGAFSLYMKYPTDLQKNFEYLFYDCKQGDANTEAIFCRGYDYATTNRTHSQDLMVLPDFIRSSTGYDNRLRPSLDLVEKFQNADGTSGALGGTGAVNVQFHYPTMSGPFNNKEPRFGGTIIAPGTFFRTATITGQRGVIYKGALLVSSNLNQYFDVTTSSFALSPVTTVIGSGNSANDNNPFWLKKWTDPVTDINLIHDYTSRTSWLDLRYGEVLLDLAEASFELGHAPSEALAAVNQIRSRGGVATYAAIDRDKIHHERFVEFAFENKSYWDYVRWRTLATDFSNRMEYGVQIYWDIDTQDYVFIKVPTAVKTYTAKNYYFDLPGNAIASSPAIGQQANGGHNPGY